MLTSLPGLVGSFLGCSGAPEVVAWTVWEGGVAVRVELPTCFIFSFG